MVDELQSVPAAQRFARARRAVVKHYQWMIRHDYLPRICDPAVVDDVFANGRRAFEPGAAATDVPTMPIEFSVAAFRFGHSMVRRAYDWNRQFPRPARARSTCCSPSRGTGGFLGEGNRLPSNWIADWRRLYRFTQPGLQVPDDRLNRAMRIDTLLVNPLAALPPGTFNERTSRPTPSSPTSRSATSPARRWSSSPSGQEMVAFLQGKGVAVEPLTRAQLRDGDGGASLAGLTGAQRQVFLERTPLWFYVLREAELNAGRLTGVGARIIAETFHRAIEGSRVSILRDPDFKPRFGPDDRTFDDARPPVLRLRGEAGRC